MSHRSAGPVQRLRVQCHGYGHGHNQQYHSRARDRRGVILLVVLALLVLYLLVAISFVTVSTHNRMSVAATAAVEQTGDDPANTLHQAALQVITGSNNPHSVIGPWGLAEDMYGIETYKSALVLNTDATPVAAKAVPTVGVAQMLYLTVSGNGPDSLPGRGNFDDDFDSTVDNATESGWKGSDDAPRFSGALNGRLLTFTNGYYHGVTTRINGYTWDNVNNLGTIRIFNPGVPNIVSTSTAADIQTAITNVLPVGTTILVNGREFSGPGVGMNPDPTVFAASNGLLDFVPTGGTNPIALMPNPTTTQYRNYLSQPVGVNGMSIYANEDYDAPDYQNMMLAARVWNPTANQWQVVLPSLHRPDLINYWLNQSGGMATWAANTTDGIAFRRGQMLRPDGALHNPTTGVLVWADSDSDGVPELGSVNDVDFSGKRFNPIHGPWDVDNDGDGVADSIWVDLGFHVTTLPDGRLIKPLIAVLVLDQDGKLSVNAHGSPSHVMDNGDHRVGPATINGPFAGGTANATLHHGQSYGPAEVNLSAVMSPGEYYNLMHGDSAIGPGRYGEVAGDPSLVNARPMPGRTVYNRGTDNSWGQTGVDDDGNGVTDDISERGYGDDVIAYANGDDNWPLAVSNTTQGDFALYGSHEDVFRRYGEPADPSATGHVGLDLMGRPIFLAMGQRGGPNDDPYELNLFNNLRLGGAVGAVGQTTQLDAPFTATEFERLLRPYDLDAQLGDNRLTQLMSGSLSANQLTRGILTTHSFHTPVPNMAPTPEIRQALADLGVTSANLSIIDLLAGKIRAANPSETNAYGIATAMLSPQGPSMPPPFNVPPVPLDTKPKQEVFAPELALGHRMDLNRPFGNNTDDDSNGTVDDPNEHGYGTEMLYGGSVNTDVSADGYSNDIYDRLHSSRYRYAKQLFTLMMMFRPENYVDRDFVPPVDTNPVLQEQLTIRRLAQWSVNVVDYMDRDSAMTPFEYDENPFDGWDVDGDLTTTEAITTRQVVWGSEAPELLLTESLAFHDRRSTDGAANGLTTDLPGGETDVALGGINDLDQERIPQGSLFFELYCPATPSYSNPMRRADLYVNNGTEDFLDLGRMAGDHPVWRVVISEETTAAGDDDIAAQLTNHPDELTFDVEIADDLLPYEPGVQQVPIERIVWFTTVRPLAADPQADRIYSNFADAPGANVWLRPGQYALVGPHRPEATTPNITSLGRTGAAPWTQEIRLGHLPATNGSGGRGPVLVSDYDGAATPTYPRTTEDTATMPPQVDIQAPLGIPIANSVVADYPTGPWGPGTIGLSVSEPLFSADYYPRPNSAATTTITHYDTLTTEYADQYNHDPSNADPLLARDIDQPFDDRVTAPLAGHPGVNTTISNYRTIFLQRLADPSRAWDATNNPYRTVDWMPVDLTIFNGETTTLDTVHADMGNPYWGSRQRGPEAGTTTVNDLWAHPVWSADLAADSDPLHEPELRSAPTPAPTGRNFAYDLRHNVDHTLGYLNEGFHDPAITAPAFPWFTADNLPAGYNYTFVGSPYTGNGRPPFPMLHWPNRPFNNAGELLTVPSSSAARLGMEHRSAVPATNEPYDFYGVPTDEERRAEYRHLLNFFNGSPANGDDTAAASTGSNYARILDFVHVPSRFTGAEDLLNSTAFNATGAGSDAYPFYAPFNRVPKLREPGLVNANTIFDDGTTQGAIQSGMILANNWSAVVQSRKWVGASGNMLNAAGQLDMNAALPTVFGNPFRAEGSPFYVPLASMRFRDLNAGGTNHYRTADAGLLRSSPTNKDQPLFSFTGTGLFNNTDRNPDFRYQGHEKISSVMTTRSNVYAIWVTVGYFEVDRVSRDVTAGDNAYPDGYKIRQEVGTDTGDIQRHRAFYLYDRSVPVGFERGQTHNVENGLMVERFLE